jgi:dihydrolipoamide dehydrogenase
LENLKVEVAIIGAGTAGMRACREVREVTDSVLLIESGPYGTTCARVGCMPSKLLIAAAEAAHCGPHAALFGVHYAPPQIDGAAVMKRVREERDRFSGFVVEAVEDWPEAQRLKARARFRSDHELELSDGRVVEAERIVIATGSRTNVPETFRDFGDRMITSDDVFFWETLPRSVVVFGAGVIGLELGLALHRLGVRVALFGHGSKVGPISDPEVRASALEIFTSDMEFHPDGEVMRRGHDATGVEIDYKVDGDTRTARFDYALVATGRRPNIDDLGLENTSLELDERGMPLFDLNSGRCGESHVFIAGDADSHLPLLHEAADEGKAAGYNAANFPEIRRFRKSAPISVVFSDPQIMMVGSSFRDLTESGADFAVGALDWSEQGRARVMGVHRGLLRVYGERNTGRFLGAEMIGPRAENIAHLLAWAYQSSLTVSDMLERPFYHPVLEEGVRTALRSLNRSLQMGPAFPDRCLDCGPGS